MRCFLCRVEGEHLDKHHIFPGARKGVSEKYGLVVTLCRRCHHMVQTRQDELYALQKYFIKKMLKDGWTRERIIKELGRSFDDD